MRTRWARVGACIAASWCVCSQAHHSGAVFDGTTEIELRGVVVDFKLRSPHASFVVDATVFENGEPRADGAGRWEVEWESAPMLKTLRIDAQTFAPGDEVVILVNPHRDPMFRFARALRVTDEFGSEYVMATSTRLFSPSLRDAAAAVGESIRDEPTGAAATAAGVAKLVGRWQQPLLQFPAGTSNLPLNAAGMAAWNAYQRKQSPANDCEPINIPDLVSAPFFLFDLRIDQGRAVLHHEAYAVVRTVPLTGAPKAADPAGRFGRVSGRIENDVLIVESARYRRSAWGLGIEEMHGGAIIPSSDRKTVTERFSATPDGRTLVYTYTLYDPAYMTAPHTGRVELTRVPDDVEMYEYDCDTESAAMWSRDRSDPSLRVGDER